MRRIHNRARILLRELHLAALRTHGHVTSLLVEVRHDVVLAKKWLRLLDHDARATQLLIKDVLVVHQAVIWNARRGRSLL